MPDTLQKTLKHDYLSLMALEFWKALEDTLILFWDTLNLREICYFLTLGLGMYIGLQEGYFDGAFYNAFAGGAFTFFALEFSDKIAKAPRYIYEQYQKKHFNTEGNDIVSEIRTIIDKIKTETELINPLLSNILEQTLSIQLGLICAKSLSVKIGVNQYANRNHLLTGMKLSLKAALGKLLDKESDKSVLLDKLSDFWSNDAASMDKTLLEIYQKENDTSTSLLQPRL